MAIIGGSTPTYQSFTDEMQDAAFNLGVGLFGIPLGTTFLAEISNYMTQTQDATVDTLYDVVMNSSVGTSASFYPTYLTDSQFAERLANNLLGTSGTLVSADAWTAGKDWVIAALATNGRAAVAKMAVDAVAGIDSADTTYGPAAAAFDNKVTVANYYTFDKAGASSDVTTLQNVISSVTNDAATVTSAEAAIDNSAIEASAKTVTLTSNADIVGTASSVSSALQVSGYNDTIFATLASAATAGTLSVVDSISGGGGTDTLSVTLTNTAASTVIMSAVEVVTMRALSNETAYFDLTNAGTGITALNVSGTSDFGMIGMTKGQTVTFTDSFSKTAILTLATDSTADSLTVRLATANPDIVATQLETLNLSIDSTTANTTTMPDGFNITTAQTLNVLGTGNVVLNLGVGSGNGRGSLTASGINAASAVGSLKTINASALNGNLTLVASTAGVDQTLVGGVGNDTFYLSAQFNQSDSLDAGAGTDTVVWTNTVTGTLRPVLQGVETLTMDFGAEAVIDLRNTSAASISTLNVLGVATGSTFSAISSATTTINIYSGASAGGVVFGYSTATSDVVVNLSNEATATSTAAYNFGDLQFAGNAGTLTVNVAGTASGQGIDKFSAGAFKSVTLNVGNDLTGVSEMFATGATAVTININGGKEFSAAASANFSAVQNLAINVSGATAATFFNDLVVGSASTVAITMGAGTTSLVVQSARIDTLASTAAATINDTITVVNAGDGDVTLGNLQVVNTATAATASVTLNINVNQTGTGAVFNATSITPGEFTTGAFNFTVVGAGTFNIGATANATAATTAQLMISATGMSTGSFLSANFTAIADTTVLADVTLGLGSAVVALGAGADRIAFGLGGQQSVIGGLGNDELTMGNTAVSFAVYESHGTAATALDGTDTIFGAGSGDVILFQGFGTATSTGSIISTAITTGTGIAFGAAHTATGQIHSATLVGFQISQTAGDFFMAVYTAAGDTVIEVSVQTQTLTAAAVFSADSITKIVLNGKGDTTALTALMRLDTNGSGLLITLI